MTRLAAAADSPTGPLADLPLLVMDTGPAAVLGALEDPAVARAAQTAARWWSTWAISTRWPSTWPVGGSWACSSITPAN